MDKTILISLCDHKEAIEDIKEAIEIRHDVFVKSKPRFPENATPQQKKVEYNRRWNEKKRKNKHMNTIIRLFTEFNNREQIACMRELINLFVQ